LRPKDIKIGGGGKRRFSQRANGELPRGVSGVHRGFAQKNPLVNLYEGMGGYSLVNFLLKSYASKNYLSKLRDEYSINHQHKSNKKQKFNHGRLFLIILGRVFQPSR
jgi:hypothetical protein